DTHDRIIGLSLKKSKFIHVVRPKQKRLKERCGKVEHIAVDFIRPKLPVVHLSWRHKINLRWCNLKPVKVDIVYTRAPGKIYGMIKSMPVRPVQLLAVDADVLRQRHNQYAPLAHVKARNIIYRVTVCRHIPVKIPISGRTYNLLRFTAFLHHFTLIGKPRGEPVQQDNSG